MLIAGGEPEEWLDSFIRRRAEKNIGWFAIINRSEASDFAVQNRRNVKRQVKMIEGVDLQVEISIFGPKVAILSTADEMVGVLIENDAIADTLRSFHKTIWNFLPTYEL